MINSDMNNGGIYRAFILGVSNEVRIYIPALFNNFKDCPINSDGSLNMEVYNKCKEFYPIPIWCLPNIEAKQYDEVHPCWVTFENGNVNKPIIMGFLGNGIKYHAGSSGGTDSSGGIISPGGGTYVGTGTTGNDNGDYIFKALIAAGASIAGACGVLGNLYVESSFVTSADNGSHRGIAQWDYYSDGNGRWNSLKKWCQTNNLDPESIEGQTQYLIYDLHNEKTWKSKSKKRTNLEGWENIAKQEETESYALKVQETVRLDFERCGDQGKSAREDATKTFFNAFKDGKIENGQYNKDIIISSKGYAWPVPGYSNISSSYGSRRSGFHYGIDITGNSPGVIRGANIIATKAGIVKINSYNAGGYGYWVAIEHENGVYSRYGHMNEQSSLAIGTNVNQGDIIGHVGTTGRSTGYHLHFEIRPNDSPVNPLDYVTKP